jgi:hypothetical protein
MSIFARCMFSWLAIGALAGCARQPEIRMADPRTGIVAISRPSQDAAAKPDTILAAVTQTDPCVQELSYYGFQDEEALLTAAKTR